MLSEQIAELLVLNAKKKKLEEMLELLDQKWTHYEQCYVFELMVIETDARRFVVDAINLENRMTEIENNLQKKGQFFIQSHKDYNEVRA